MDLLFLASLLLLGLFDSEFSLSSEELEGDEGVGVGDRCPFFLVFLSLFPKGFRSRGMIAQFFPFGRKCNALSDAFLLI